MRFYIHILTSLDVDPQPFLRDHALYETVAPNLQYFEVDSPLQECRFLELVVSYQLLILNFCLQNVKT